MKSSPQYLWKDGYYHFQPEYPGQPEYIPEREKKQAKAQELTLLDTNAVMALADKALQATAVTRHIPNKEASVLDQRVAELSSKLGPTLARFAAGLNIRRRPVVDKASLQAARLKQFESLHGKGVASFAAGLTIKR